LVLSFLTPTLGLDDVYVMLAASGFYTGAPSEYLLISNVILGKILKELYQSLPGLNWYGYFLTSLNFICMTILLFLLQRNLKSWISLFIFLVLFLAFGIEFYIRLHYTFIAFTCGFTSLFLILFLSPPKKFFLQIFYYTTIVFLFVIAFLIRKESFYGIFAFSFLALGYNYLIKREHFIALTIFAVILLGFALKFYDSNYYKKNFDPNFSKYFASQYVINSENKVSVNVDENILSKLNWTNNDISLIKGWLWADHQVFSQDKLIYFSDNVKRTKSIKETINTLYREIIIKPPSIKYFILLLAILVLAIFTKSSRRFFIITFINTFLVLVLLAVFLNLNYRVLRPVWFFLTVVNILFFLRENSFAEIKNKIVKSSLIIIAIIISGISVMVIKHQNDVNEKLRRSFSSAFNEINHHPDKIFVFRTIYDIYGFPAFIDPNEFSSRNIIITDWFTYSPVYNEILRFHQIENNLMKELIKNNNLFIVNSSILEPYLKDFYKVHYDEDICFHKEEGFEHLDITKLRRCKEMPSEASQELSETKL
jgi:hypothetical protein